MPGGRFYHRQDIPCPLDFVAFTPKWIPGEPRSTKTLKLRLVAEMITGFACNAAARQMPSGLGCAKHVHRAYERVKIAMHREALNINTSFRMFNSLKPDDR